MYSCVRTITLAFIKEGRAEGVVYMVQIFGAKKKINMFLL